MIRVLAAHHNNSDHCSTSGSTSSLGLASGDSQHYLESATSVSSSRCGVKSTTAFPAAAPNVCVLRLLSVRSISTFLLVAILCLVAFLATSSQRNPANRLFVKTHVRAEDHHHHFISADKQIQPQQVSLQSQDGVHDSVKFHNIRCSSRLTSFAFNRLRTPALVAGYLSIVLRSVHAAPLTKLLNPHNSCCRATKAQSTSVTCYETSHLCKNPNSKVVVSVRAT